MSGRAAGDTMVIDSATALPLQRRCEQQWSESLRLLELDLDAPGPSVTVSQAARDYFGTTLSVENVKRQLQDLGRNPAQFDLGPSPAVNSLSSSQIALLAQECLGHFTFNIPNLLDVFVPASGIPSELSTRLLVLSLLRFQHFFIAVIRKLGLLRRHVGSRTSFLNIYHTCLHQKLAANEHFQESIEQLIRESLRTKRSASTLPSLALAPVLADLGYSTFVRILVKRVALAALSERVVEQLEVTCSEMALDSTYQPKYDGSTAAAKAATSKAWPSRTGSDYSYSSLPKFKFWVEGSLAPNVVDWLWALEKAKGRSCLNHPVNDVDVLAPDYRYDGDLTHMPPAISNFLRQMKHALNKQICQARSIKLFDIVLEYPRSTPALEDLRLTLLETNAHTDVAAHFQQSLRTRVLHPGHTTSDIIHVYILTVRSLRHIDATGVVLSLVVPPLRAYLRSRPDTVSVIVSGLVDDDKSSHLRLELEHASQRRPLTGPDGNVLARDADIDDADEDDDEDLRLGAGASAWMPRPVSAGPNFAQTRTADIINMLITIFNDRVGFIGALEHSMAERLIRVRKHATVAEVRTNEILKRRFGDASFARCDIMLADVVASRMTDDRVHGLINSPVTANTSPARKALPDMTVDGLPAAPQALRALHPVIVSRQFWPELEGTDDGSSGGLFGNGSSAGSAATAPLPAKIGAAPDIGSGQGTTSLRMPGQLGAALEMYGRFYTNVKDTRKLRWLTNVGRVKVCVEMRDKRTFEGEVTPLQAAVVELVGQMSQRASDLVDVTAAGVAAILTVTEAAALNALYFWAAKGILRELPTNVGTFEVVEVLAEAGRGQSEVPPLPPPPPIPEPLDRKPVQEAITKVLRTLGSANSNRLWTACRAHLGYSESHTTFVQLLQQLRDEGLLRESDRGAWRLV